MDNTTRCSVCDATNNPEVINREGGYLPPISGNWRIDDETGDVLCKECWEDIFYSLRELEEVEEINKAISF